MRTAIKRLVFVVLLLALVPVGFVGFIYRQTLKGIYGYTIAYWPEDAYKGRPVVELQRDLGLDLEWCSVGGFEGVTGRDVKPDERVMLFYKGEPYPWFPIGTAQNAGFVVIQNSTNGEIVVDILRTAYVDSL